jgi:hypothetical protein
MDTIKEYEQAKRCLHELRMEEISLPYELRAAADAGNAVELVRLRKRQADLPSEIFAAEVMVHQTNVARLKAEQADAHNRLDSAKSKSKSTDERTKSALRVLDEERKKVNAESFSALNRIFEIENEIRRRDTELAAAQTAVSEMMREATAA